MDLAPRSARLDVPVGGDSNVARKPFDLLRWYAWVSLAIIVSIAVGLGLISSHFIINESVERDALLSAQFIQAIADAEVRHVSIPNVRTMGELLDPRTDQAMPDVDPDARRRARGEFLDHIAHLPDMLLANIYAPDRTVIWSSNPALTGKSIESDEDLEQARSWADLVKVERIEAEREALLRELAGATGLHGRSRTLNGSAERARVAVRKAIAAALERIDVDDPATARLLRASVRTGGVCRYDPDPDAPIEWLLGGDVTM